MYFLVCRKIELSKARKSECDFCDEPRGKVLEYDVTDEDGKILHTFFRCSGCLITLILQVLSIAPIFILLASSLLGHDNPLIAM